MDFGQSSEFVLIRGKVLCRHREGGRGLQLLNLLDVIEQIKQSGRGFGQLLAPWSR
jgi:hypothetical protein